MLNAFTVDVEDYFQVSAFERVVSRRDWDLYPSRVVANTRRLLHLLERFDVRATFFVLGWVAARFPDLVREIARCGHEIGCHSYWHRLVYTLTPEEFADDLRQAKGALEDAIGAPVTSYRAPSYSITRRSLWALDILAAEGFTYDSSVFPICHDRYGIPDANPLPHRYTGSHGSIWEFPPSVIRLGRLNVPVGGGGYFRLLPAWWTERGVAWLNAQGRPFLFYIHPWEIDPQQPRLPGTRWKWRHYVNLATTYEKLEMLLSRVRFGPMTEVLNDAGRCVAVAT
ncbi:MAG: DUF3473 domain-containing protein [Gemmataceae bacterium]|nr:DUF3473 domain-containing protein [Gemmataceae bacterium]MDW8264214.1 DUF3473 domain-containing protein [Gemmataceae bacterium]